MSNVALLLSIRHQLNDMLEALKSRAAPEVLEGEELKERWWRIQKDHELYICDYGPDADFSRVDVRPIKVTYFSSLLPVLTHMRRLDQYIESARSPLP